MPIAALLRRDTMKMAPSVLLAVLLTAAAGLPGFVPLSEARQAAPLRLYAMTEIEAGSHGHFVTNAQINGSRVKVLVDTGASVVALTYRDAQKAGLKPQSLDFNVSVSTANGEGKAARVMLDDVEIDNLRVDNVQGLVMPEGALDVTLLGMSYLSRLESFSVQNGKLVLED